MIMETIRLDDFLDGGIIRENSFREQVSKMDFGRFQDQKVIIKGCAQLAQVAEKIYYGEPRYAVKIFNRDK